MQNAEQRIAVSGAAASYTITRDVTLMSGIATAAFKLRAELCERSFALAGCGNRSSWRGVRLRVGPVAGQEGAEASGFWLAEALDPAISDWLDGLRTHHVATSSLGSRTRL